MTRWFFCLLLVSALLSAGTEAAISLKYSVDVDSDKAKSNIRAWLGNEPQTPEQRARFLATLDERLVNSLQAVGYYMPDIDIQVDKSRDPWVAAITVSTNEPVRLASVVIGVHGAAENTPEFNQLIAESTLDEGTVFHHGDYESLKKSILTLGQRLGYLNGRMRIHKVEISPDKSLATLELQYDSGQRYKFGQLEHDENQIDKQLIGALRTYDEGENFDIALLQKFQAKLQKTQFFSSVVVRPRMGEPIDGRVPVVVKLQPAKRHNFDVGAGYSTDTKERASVTWRSPRLNRRGHSQETRIEYSPVNPSGRIAYNIPLTHPLDDILQLGARVEENQFGDLNSLQRELGVRRELRSGGAWVRSYFLRALNESWKVNGDNRENTYYLPGVTYSHKTRQGSLVDPVSGFSQIYRLEGASANLGSDIDLVRGYSKFIMVSSFTRQHRLVTRAELGAVILDNNDRGELAPSLSFFAGGSQSIRGFGYQSLGNELPILKNNGAPKTITVGGDRLAIASIEYQYYVNDTWRGALFFDAGDAFDEGEFNLNYGAGFGLHYLTPVGAFKIEVAKSLSDDSPDWRVHINIGAEF